MLGELAETDVSPSRQEGLLRTALDKEPDLQEYLGTQENRKVSTGMYKSA